MYTDVKVVRGRRDERIALRFLRCQHHLDVAVINPVEGESEQMTDWRRRKLAAEHSVEEISPAHCLIRVSQGTGIAQWVMCLFQLKFAFNL
jgi:hypothetical protein